MAYVFIQIGLMIITAINTVGTYSMNGMSVSTVVSGISFLFVGFMTIITVIIQIKNGGN